MFHIVPAQAAKFTVPKSRGYQQAPSVDTKASFFKHLGFVRATRQEW
jgi:hypothetical protein